MAVQERCTRILCTVDVIDEREYVGRIILVHRRVCIGTDYNKGKRGVAEHQNGYHRHHKVQNLTALLYGIPDSGHCSCREEYEIDIKPGVIGQSESVHEEEFEPSCHLDDTRDENEIEHTEYPKSGQQGPYGTFRGDFVLAEIPDENDDRQCKQVQQVYSYG